MSELQRPFPALRDRVSAAFATAIAGLDLTLLDRQRYPVFGLADDLTLAYFNEGWFDFARANQGAGMLAAWPVGRPLFDAIPASLSRFYEHAFQQVKLTGAPWEHRYECSSAVERRWFAMRVLPLRGAGLLVINSLATAEAIAAPVERLTVELYQQPDGVIVQCSHCRRVRRSGTAERWDFVPALVESHPAMVSHGLCSACLAYHYPASDDEADDVDPGADDASR